MTGLKHRNLALIFIALIFSFASNPVLLQAFPETQHQEVQQGNDMQEALRPRTSVDDRSRNSAFGDTVGVTALNDEDWEKQASAAGLTTENFSDVNGEQNEEQYESDLKGIEARTAPTAEELERQRQYELQQIRVFEEEMERQNRLRILTHERLSREREDASRASRRFAERAGADGKWTQEELDEYERLTTTENELWQFTPEEAAEMERQNAVRTQVVDDIRRAAANMGGTSEQEIADRAQNANMVDAGTKTWRNATFTGRMVNEVGRDITAQRELGIKANNTMMAAQAYMNRTDITAEQRAAAQQIYDAAHFARGAAADAISKDAALILAGTASDVAVLGVGRPVSIVAGKVGQGVRSVWNGLFGGTEAAATTAGAEVGAALGGTASTTGRAAGTEAGTVAGTAGRTTGTEAGTAAGTRAAGTEASTAGSAGRTAGEEAGAAGSGKAPSQMTRAERQAYNDAKAQQAASEGWRSGKAMEDGGSGILAAPKGALTQPAAGELSKNLTQAEINALFQPGANLTSQQIMQKADLLLTSFRPPAIGGPAPQLPGVVAGVADDAATVILPGQQAAAGISAEAGTVITKPGAAAASGGTTQAFNGAITLPGSTAPGAVTGAAAEAGTVITRPGAAAAGGTTQAFNGAITLPGSAPSAATGGATQAFNGAITLPGSGAATGVSSQAGTIITGAGGRGAAEAAAGGSTTIINPAGQGIGVSSQAGTIITGQGGRGAAQATSGTTIIERGAGR